MNNDMYMTHVGYNENGCDKAVQAYFSDDTISFVQQKVDALLRCDFPQGVVVPCQRIRDVINAVYQSYRPAIGDIFTRYNIPGDYTSYNMVNTLINQTVSIIVNDIKNNLGTEANNASLDRWNSVLGEANPLGLRSHGPIKIRKRKGKTLLFNMNY